MAKLIYAAIASLDGYVEDTEGTFDWSAPDHEVHAFVNDLERPIGTYLYGRRMYETWIQITQFLRSGQFDPMPVVTHRFPLAEHAEAIRAIKSGEAGKVIFEIA